MEPAYRISATDDQMKLLGEVCAIQGQIEYLMQNAIQRLLEIELDTLLKICPRGGLGQLNEFFVAVVRDKYKGSHAGAAETAYSTIKSALAEGRNDFVHAVYAHDGDEGGPGFSLSHMVSETPVAVRTGSRKKTPLKNLRAVRDEAARISCALAAFNYRISMPELDRTPWDGRW